MSFDRYGMHCVRRSDYSDIRMVETLDGLLAEFADLVDPDAPPLHTDHFHDTLLECRNAYARRVGIEAKG